MKIWILIVAVYAGPPSSIDWDGPWEFWTWSARDKTFKSEAECRNLAIQIIGKMHQEMLAPVRFECVPFAASLPKGAPR